jgi:hypothetical protein
LKCFLRQYYKAAYEGNGKKISPGKKLRNTIELNKAYFSRHLILCPSIPHSEAHRQSVSVGDLWMSWPGCLIYDVEEPLPSALYISKSRLTPLISDPHDAVIHAQGNRIFWPLVYTNQGFPHETILFIL